MEDAGQEFQGKKRKPCREREQHLRSPCKWEALNKGQWGLALCSAYELRSQIKPQGLLRQTPSLPILSSWNEIYRALDSRWWHRRSSEGVTTYLCLCRALCRHGHLMLNVPFVEVACCLGKGSDDHLASGRRDHAVSMIGKQTRRGLGSTWRLCRSWQGGQDSFLGGREWALIHQGLGCCRSLARGSPLGLAPTCLLSTHKTEASPWTMEGREGELRNKTG